MTGSTITTLAASPETGLVSIRFKHLLFRCRICFLDAASAF
jgi:hypothetical protein